MLSISNKEGVRPEPAPGCVEQKLDTSKNLFMGMPNVIIKDSSLLPFNEDLNALLESFRNQYLQFVAHMQTPHYKLSLAQQIEDEKVSLTRICCVLILIAHSCIQKKRALLLVKVENEERSITGLQQSGCDLLKCRLSEIGIFANNQSEMFDKANEILMRNKKLHEQSCVIQQQVQYFENVNEQLLKVYDPKLTKRDAKGKKQILQAKMLEEFQKQNGVKQLVNVHQQESSIIAIEKAITSSLPRLSTPSPATSSLSASSNSPILAKNPVNINMKDTFQIANANDRINSMIVAALNDGKQATATTPAVTTPLKQEKPKRKYERRSKNVDKLIKGNKEMMDQSVAQSVTSETITNVREIKKIEPVAESKPIDNSGDPSSLPYSNSMTKYNKSPPQEPQEDKKPLTLTLGKSLLLCVTSLPSSYYNCFVYLVIDRRDNSASVKSPPKSPDKNSPKHESKRKNSYSDQVPKKFKYVSSSIGLFDSTNPVCTQLFL